MGTPSYREQHLGGAGFVCRLSQDQPIEYDRGIGAEDHGPGIRPNSQGLVTGEAHDHSVGILTVNHPFVDVRDGDGEFRSGSAQEKVPPG